MDVSGDRRSVGVEVSRKAAVPIRNSVIVRAVGIVGELLFGTVPVYPGVCAAKAVFSRPCGRQDIDAWIAHSLDAAVAFSGPLWVTVVQQPAIAQTTVALANRPVAVEPVVSEDVIEALRHDPTTTGLSVQSPPLCCQLS